MHDIRAPAKLFHGLNYTFTEENGALVIVLKELIFFVVEHGLTVKIILVVNKVHLQLGIRNRCDLDDQRLFLVTYSYVNTRKTHHLVQAVFTFVNQTKPWHENADLHPSFLHRLW